MVQQQRDLATVTVKKNAAERLDSERPFLRPEKEDKKRQRFRVEKAVVEAGGEAEVERMLTM